MLIRRIRELKLATLQDTCAVTQTVCAAIQALFAVVGIIATVAVTWMVWNGSERLAKIEYERAISEAWTAVDSAILSDEKNLKVHDKYLAINATVPLGDQGPTDPTEMGRKRQMGYMTLNVLATTFAGISRGIIDKKATENLDYNLRRLVLDDQIYELSQRGVYQIGFAEHCKALRESLQRAQGRQPAANGYGSNAESATSVRTSKPGA